MKKLLFSMVLLACFSGGQAYADYTFSFMSSDGNYGLQGQLTTSSNGNGPLTVTGGSLTGNGRLNSGVSYSLLPAGVTYVNTDGGGADLFGADNLLLPGSNPVLDSNGMIFRINTNNPNGNLAIGIWGNGQNNYSYFQSWSAYVSGTVTLTAVAPLVNGAALNNNSTPVGYSPSWLIITLLSLAIAGGYLMRKRMAQQ